VNRILFAALLLVLLAGGGYVWWRERYAAPVAVRLHTVERGPVEVIVANTRAGTVEAQRRGKLAPQTGGQVATLNVREGSKVAAGDVLLELWNEDLRAQVALSESEVVRARALIEQAQYMAEVAERDSKRLLELRERNIASEEQTDRMVAESKARQAELAAARAALQVAENKVRAAVAAVDRTILRAPFAGVVAEVNAELGEYVTPSPPGIPTLPAIDLIDTSKLNVKAPIDEVDAPQVRVGMPARILLDAFAGRRFAGRVTRVSPYVLDREREARTVDVDVEFVDQQEAGLMLPGASADVEIVVHSVADCVRLPTEALLEGKQVLVYGGEGEALEARELTVGAGNFAFTEVLSGVAPGERVVLSLDREGVRAGVPAVPDPSAGAGAQR
jgi:HlyD family secretion protein